MHTVKYSENDETDRKWKIGMNINLKNKLSKPKQNKFSGLLVEGNFCQLPLNSVYTTYIKYLNSC